MLINKFLDFCHCYTKYLYDDSILLKNIDYLILGLILLTFLVSVFVSSDVIGYLAMISGILTVFRILVTPNDNVKCELFEVFLLVFFIISLVSVAGSTLLALSIKGFLKTLMYIMFYLTVVHHLKYNKKSIIPILWMIGLCIMSQSIVGLSQNFIKVDEISGWQDVSNLDPNQVITRVYGTLKPLNPNLLGGYFVAGIPALFGLSGYYLAKKNYLLTFVFLVFAFISSVVLFLTGCRGAYIALFAILCSLFIISLKFFWENYKKWYISIVSAIIGFSSAVIVAVAPIRTRILSIFSMRNDSSNSYRFNVYKSSFEMFKDNWLLGIGQGNQNFREIYGLYMKTGFDALSSYNIYLETAVESGIFGLLAFLLFIFTLIGQAVIYIKNSIDIKNVVLISTALLSLIGLLTHGLVDTVFFRPQIQIIFWTMIAILSNRLYSEKETY